MRHTVGVLVVAAVIIFVLYSCASGSAVIVGEDGSKKNVSVDIDITKLSSTMVYAEVSNIMASPDDYMGKTIKVRGKFNASYFDQTDKYYYYVVVSDATACCQNGIEFIWNGSHIYPDDYPAANSEIEVVGTFSSYVELDTTYYYLSIDSITVITPAQTESVT
jgi:hypothetical protein